LVARLRLLERLTLSQARLVVVGAGAGWGKTTLLAQWCARGDADFAWLSLDGADNDPVRFWAYVIAALGTVRSGLGESALPLLRARGELLEVHAEELRFDEAESAYLLNELLGLELAADDVERLQARTEGWAAGLYLAALSLRSREDRGAFVQAFAGDDRHLVDYLGDEVLAGLAAERRSFLLHTS